MIQQSSPSGRTDQRSLVQCPHNGRHQESDQSKLLDSGPWQKDSPCRPDLKTKEAGLVKSLSASSEVGDAGLETRDRNLIQGYTQRQAQHTIRKPVTEKHEGRPGQMPLVRQDNVIHCSEMFLCLSVFKLRTSSFGRKEKRGHSTQKLSKSK